MGDKLKQRKQFLSMSKYVPRFLKEQPKEQKEQPKEQPKEQSKPSRWVEPVTKETSAKGPVLVNTSLPAKMAPKLPPATLASLTHQLDKVSIKKSTPIPLVSDQEFPTLGGTKASVPVSSGRPTFSELSRNWAKKQEEEKTIAKEESDREKARVQQLATKPTTIQEEARKLGFKIISVHSSTAKKSDSDEDQDAESTHISEEDSYGSDDLPYEEEEEEEEYGCDGVWDPRKHRDELY